MNQFVGVIGYANQVETSPGIWRDQISEISVRGTILKNIRRWNEQESATDNLTLQSRFSVIAPPKLVATAATMRYITVDGHSWEVTSFEIEHPRIVISIGGIYNGN